MVQTAQLVRLHSYKEYQVNSELETEWGLSTNTQCVRSYPNSDVITNRFAERFKGGSLNTDPQLLEHVVECQSSFHQSKF